MNVTGITDPEYVIRNDVQQLVGGHPRFRSADFKGCFSVLRRRYGLRRGAREYLRGWLTALSICHRYGYGWNPRMATAFLNATVNLGERCESPLRHEGASDHE